MVRRRKVDTPGDEAPGFPADFRKSSGQDGPGCQVPGARCQGNGLLCCAMSAGAAEDRVEGKRSTAGLPR
jgi:hypothetical protein